MVLFHIYRHNVCCCLHIELGDVWIKIARYVTFSTKDIAIYTYRSIYIYIREFVIIFLMI